MSDIFVESPQVQVNVDGPPDANVAISTATIDVQTTFTEHEISVSQALLQATIEAFESVDINVVGVPTSVDAITELPSINIEVVGGGGGSVEKQFRTVDLVLNIPSGQSNESMLGGKQFFVLGYTSSVAGIWIRGYADTASRTADASRLITADPDLNSGVLFEVLTQVGTHLFSVPVTAYGNPTMPLLVESAYELPIDTTITFSIY